ncbi:uncharacterized protein LOC114317570 [Camellia sinensis]|uniref:uncharacterized protein LOC114317570 n=1 Tax=Camellia sinensis TaxID=4442 RepID=UPI0010363CC2|nr:uncharacterized protein LOC114317570 [Camellia sinensis]
MGDKDLDADESGADGSPRGIASQTDRVSDESDPNPRGSDKIVVELPPPSPMVKWEACLVGYFIDKNLPYTLIKNNANNMWKNKGLVDILKNDDGFFFFMFENRDYCIDVLEGGPWYVGGFLLILKQWHRMMKLSKEDKKTIPIWVKFHNIPLEYWDGDGLGRIASAVGVPLFMDQLTSSGSRISFARVCVDISAVSEFPDSFIITSGDVSMNIHVEYQGVPSRCMHCHVFGHETKTCLSAQVTHLIELQKNSKDRVEVDEGWTTVTDKGKRKVGDQICPLQEVPTEVDSSSATKGGDLDPESEEAVPQPEIEENAANVMGQIDASHSEAMETVETTTQAVEENIRNTEDVGEEEMRAKPPELHGGKKDGGLKVGSSTKQKSSGRSGSQKKKRSFFSTFVYAENKHELRLPLFFDLKKIALNYASHPSVFLGDFNVVRFSFEKMGGRENWSRANEVFNSMVLDSELEDLCYKGCQFTWSNKQGGGNFITSKIDRVLVNERWLTVNPNSYALFLPSGVSDHSPVIVQLGGEEAKLKKPFKFFDFWANHCDFLPSVYGVWRKYIRGSPMFRVCQKLKTLKPILKELNKKEYSEISTRVGVAKDHLLNSQIKLDKDPLNLTLQETERAAYVKYIDLSKAEESLAHQKSRIQWLGLGDRNSKFFFRNVKGNVNKGRIHSVVLPNGDRVTKSAEVHHSFVDYFFLGK